MEVRPLFHHVAVRQDPAPKTFKGTSLYRPDNVQDNPKNLRGTVVGVGPGKVLETGSLRAMSVRLGDRVEFDVYKTREIDLGDSKVLVMEEDNILAVLED